MRTRVHRPACRIKPGVLIPVVAVLGTLSCAGPQPLDVAIDPHDEDAYRAHLSECHNDGAAAYADWMADERRTSVAEIRQADKDVSETRNPFDANRDPGAVSRGAVVYKWHCTNCHGFDARGNGLMADPDHPPTNFKTFGKRITATLHRGAPRKWFRVIRDGAGDEIEYLGERTTAMPAFGDKLTREQIWLVITYLQSLDVYARPARKDGHAR